MYLKTGYKEHALVSKNRIAISYNISYSTISRWINQK
jgi:DNA invertase Pin-like site-specific DNA recombinase